MSMDTHYKIASQVKHPIEVSKMLTMRLSNCILHYFELYILIYGYLNAYYQQICQHDSVHISCTNYIRKKTTKALIHASKKIAQLLTGNVTAFMQNSQYLIPQILYNVIGKLLSFYETKTMTLIEVSCRYQAIEGSL